MVDQDAFFELLFAIPDHWFYALLFFSALIENVLPPYPGDMITFLAALRVGQGQLQLLPAGLAVLVGNAMGAILMYRLGMNLRLFLSHVEKRNRILNQKKGNQKKGGWGWWKIRVFSALGQVFSEANLETTNRWLSRWGLLFVFVSRFSLGLRFLVSVVAGLTRIPWGRYMFVFCLGVILFNFCLFWIGIEASHRIDEFTQALSRYGFFFWLAMFLLLALFALRMVFRLHNRRKQTRLLGKD